MNNANITARLQVAADKAHAFAEKWLATTARTPEFPLDVAATAAHLDGYVRGSLEHDVYVERACGHFVNVAVGSRGR